MVSKQRPSGRQRHEIMQRFPKTSSSKSNTSKANKSLCRWIAARSAKDTHILREGLRWPLARENDAQWKSSQPRYISREDDQHSSVNWRQKAMAWHGIRAPTNCEEILKRSSSTQTRSPTNARAETQCHGMLEKFQ
jgi:hypothetical protein